MKAVVVDWVAGQGDHTAHKDLVVAAGLEHQV